MGGGALSSNVSKLGSKEVRKICHLERSERSQSNEVSKLGSKEVSKILRNFNLAPWGEGVRRTGEGSRVEGKVYKIAFTLAEVLIALGIIGIVAALTLPSVVAHYKEKVLVTQVQKAYSEMQNALKMYSAQNNCSDITCISDTNQTSAELADKLFAQFQGAKRCPGDWDMTRKICKTVQIKNKTPYYENGVTASGDGFSPVFVSANGVAYKVKQYDKCPSEFEITLRDDAGFPILDEDGKPKKKKGKYVNCALIYFDANGVNKGPNQFGADIYRFNLTYDGKFVSYGDMINPALTKGKLEYTPHKLGQPKK